MPGVLLLPRPYTDETPTDEQKSFWDLADDAFVKSTPTVADWNYCLVISSAVALSVGIFYSLAAERVGLVWRRFRVLELLLAMAYFMFGVFQLVTAGLWTRNFTAFYDASSSTTTDDYYDDDGSSNDDDAFRENFTACSAGCVLAFLSAAMQTVLGLSWAVMNSARPLEADSAQAVARLNYDPKVAETSYPAEYEPPFPAEEGESPLVGKTSNVV